MIFDPNQTFNSSTILSLYNAPPDSLLFFWDRNVAQIAKIAPL